jgi:hypothetical protein
MRPGQQETWPRSPIDVRPRIQLVAESSNIVFYRSHLTVRTTPDSGTDPKWPEAGVLKASVMLENSTGSMPGLASAPAPVMTMVNGDVCANGVAPPLSVTVAEP